MNLFGKHVLVIGLGETGLAMAKWLARQGALVRVADSRAEPPNVDALRAFAPGVVLRTGPFAEESFSGIDLIALSPGVPVQEPKIQQAVARGVPVVSEIELFAWGARQMTPRSKIVAITGSNGKTTTTALVAYLLTSVGVPAVACGNISPAALNALMDAIHAGKMPKVWVLELSSFQLEKTFSLNADAATVLNISEDHLDRYDGMDGYVAAKARVFEGRGVMVVNRDDVYSRAWPTEGREVVSFGLAPSTGEADYGLDAGWIVRGGEPLVALSSLKLVGLHNAANAMAAMALCEAVGIAPRALLPALCRFSGLAHRVAFVTEIGGVSYYDDSKGTNVGATLAALQGLGRPVAIILGGEGKEQDFSPLKAGLAQHARAVALIGRDAGLIGEAIAGCGVPVERCADMAAAVAWCAGQTRPGDAVLLSPACASFDMFRNYAHRADAFIDAVHAFDAAHPGGEG